MALSAWFLCLIFASQIIGQECKGIFDDIDIQFDSTLDGFNVRGTREVESSGDGSGIGISCPTSLKADAFSSVSKSLASSIDECIQSPPNAYYEYKVTPDSSASFTTNSLNDHILYADYFSPDTTHHVTVEATCILCDVQTIELNLEISIENYTLKLFPYGVLTSDESLTDVDDGYTDVSMDVHFPVPVYGNRYRKAYLSSNGLMSFEKPQINWYPVPFPYGENQVPTLAPYWTDLNLTSSSVYYNTYYHTAGKRAEIVLNLTSERVSSFIDEDYTGQWMLVATWSSVTLYSSNQDEVITFQLILISDFVNTYALYLYDDFHIEELVSTLTIGHSAADYISYHNVQFDTSNIYLQMDTHPGNTEESGQWIFNVSSQSTLNEAELSCVQWANRQSGVSWVDGLPSCPCTEQQAIQDWQYNFDQTQRINCAIFLPSTTQSTVECCYDNGGSLITGSEKGSSGYLRYHPIFYPEDHKSNDSDPYTYCCENSSNCEAYRVFRPPANCSAYVPPAPGFIWGDPHFETLDKESFTFNGIGEFLLLSSSENDLTIQIRMEQYQTSKATVINSVVIKHKSIPKIQLEIDSNKDIMLYFNGQIQSDSLPSAGKLIVLTTTTIHHDSTLSDVDPTSETVFLVNINNTYVVATSTGAVIRVGFELQFLYCVVELSDGFLQNTEGLLGYFDNNSSNDYRISDGTILSSDLTEEQLYSNFGLKWHVSQSDSLFTYHDGKTYNDYNTETLTFSPNFGTGSLDSNSVLKAQAEAQCDGDYSCLYDTAQTGNVSIGIATHEIRNLNTDTEHELENFSPVINGTSLRLIVTAGTEYIAAYTATDPDTDTTTEINIKDPVPEGMELNSTGHLIIGITSLPSVPLYLTSSDSNNTVTTQRVSVLLCDCKNNGECIKDDAFIPLDSNGHHRLTCGCDIGFGGNYCEDDLRGCGLTPCPSFTTCEDDSNSNGGYRCVNCETGYKYDTESKCVDVDECADGTNSCSQVCTNTDGSYKCSCNNGYRIDDDGFTCNDIDECLELTDGCAHYCTNEDGSFTCSCDQLWILSNDAKSCLPFESCSNCGDAGCSAQGNLISCSCPKGTDYFSNTCTDCSSGLFGYDCQHVCDCKNGGTCQPLGCVCVSSYTGYNCETEINNYLPIFSSDSITTIKLPEAIPKDTSILYLEAVDDDVGFAGIVSYSIVSALYGLPSNVSNGLTVFTINATSGLLSNTVPLANQNTTEYLLAVEAKDGATDSNKQTHILHIEVVDTDLPQPYFSSDKYQEYVYENKTKGSVILTDIVCSEKDSFNLDVVDLQIDIVSGNINSTFEVINNKIVTSINLDYETVKTFELKLNCKNAFNNIANTNATIIILNINDNPFKFDKSSYTIETFENATSGNTLETFQAADADHPDFLVEYFLTLNPYADIFTLNKTTGVLSVGTIKPFDRESNDNYTVTVTAYLYDDDSSIKHTVETDVFIIIKDINDFTPLFDQSLYTLTNLSQSNNYNDTVIFVSAIDNDLESNGEFVYSIQNNENFDINPNTGEVFIIATFLDKGTYTLNLYATDSGIPSLIGTSVVDIYVKATPNEIYFTKNKYVFNVLESGAFGLVVGVVEATLYDVVNVSIVTELQYDIQTTMVVPFSLKSKGGEIILQSALDYEQEDFYEFKIAAFYPDNTTIPVATTVVQIIVEDVNDNSPVFIPATYSTLIYDDTEIGSTILTVYASDKDENSNQNIVYSIEDFSSPFDISSTGGDVYVNRNLELAQDYHFEVTATDSGQPSMYNEAIVHISVVRRGAIHPLLNSAKMVFDIHESIDAGGSLVGIVKALIEGNITVASAHGIGFRLRQPEYGYNVDTPFTIDTSSGEVTTLEHTFDHESQEEYVFYVELFDISNTDTVYDSAPILVKVLDVNDEQPVFEEDQYSVSVLPTAGSDTTILTVSAIDNDSGKNSEVLYSLNSTSLGFHINPYTGTVSLVNSTQISGDYSMTVTATDQGNPYMSSTVNVYVSIKNSVQNISFSESSYTFTVIEHSPKSTVIGNIAVTEVNGGAFLYDDLSFQLFPSYDCIDNDGRSIIVSCDNLDREKQALYNVSMTVEHSSLGAAGMVDIQVSIIDINDNEPSFDKDVYTVLVSNDFNVTDVLLNPVVVDKDGSGSITEFTISTLNPDIFIIDSTTGAVTVTSVPPIGDYSFKIIATDFHDDSLSDEATVHVSVFVPGPKTLEFVESSLTHSIPENSPGGMEIGVLQLLAPSLVNPAEYIGNLDFVIVSGDNPDYFYIDDTNATLILLNDFLDRETVEKHIIIVQASFTDYKLSTEAHVTIDVTDKNDNAPQFSKSVYSTSIPSTSVIGTSITVVVAKDDDIGDNANVSYSFQENEANFTIDSVTGHVTTAAELSSDTQYVIVVVATDGGTPQLSSTCIVSVFAEIAIPDSISFTSQNYHFSISENNNLGSYVGSISIKEDTQFLEGLVFTFITPSDNNEAKNLKLFHLDAVTGNISALSSIDREEVEDIEAMVSAIVPNNPSLTASAIVKITILDENDNAPTFETSIYLDNSLTEGSVNTQTIILTVKAIDQDKDNNGEVTYQILNEGDSTYFMIDSSGNIKASSVDIESGYYHITVSASDDGSTPLTGTAEVLITVYAPLPDGIGFQLNNYVFNIQENTTPGTLLSATSLKLKPINLDYVSLLQYTTSNQEFIVVGVDTSSDLYSTISFDFDTEPNSYEFTVTCTAYLTMGSQDVVSTNVPVTVNLIDVNDNAPQFIDVPVNGVYDVQVIEEIGSNIQIIELSTVDIDSGSNKEIEFTLLNNYNDNFKISNLGQIRSGNNKIDREVNSEFLLTVFAADKGDPSLTGTALVHITVLDINDNVPIMLTGNLFYISEEQPLDVVLFQVTATDPDNGINGTVTYGIQDGDTNYFSINSTSGEIYSKVKLDYEDADQKKNFTLSITIIDGGLRSIIEELSIRLINVYNDNRPQFITNTGPIEIPKNVANGTVIIQVIATDLDEDVLEYQINESVFTIDNQGTITKATNEVLAIGTILITITVTDNSKYKLSSEMIVTINIIEGNVIPTTSSSSTTTSVTRTSSSVVVSTSEPGSPSGGSSPIGFAVAGIFAVLFIIAIIIIVILVVLTVTKRRERVNQKTRDPYGAAEENWILKDSSGNAKRNDKKEKKLKKKSKNKIDDLEMERRSSLVDSSAYETMFEDDMLDFPIETPWTKDQNYQADSEDNHSGFTSSNFGRSKPKIQKPNKPTLGISKPPQNLSKPTGLTRPSLNTPNSSTKPALSKPSATKNPSKPTTSSTRDTTSPSKPSMSTPAKVKPTPKTKSTTNSSGAKPPVKKVTPSAPKKTAGNQSSPPRQRRSKRASSIDSTASELTDEYLDLNVYGSAKPMKPGERPSEYDMFLKQDDESGKPPPGTRPSLKNLGWNQ